MFFAVEAKDQIYVVHPQKRWLFSRIATKFNQ